MRRQGKLLILAAAAVGAAALGLGGLAYWQGDGAAPADAESLALGRALYGEHCASCHGADLEGEPNWRERRPDGKLPAPPHDATGHTWHHPDEQLFAITKHGIEPFAPPGYRSDMPAFGAVLSDPEIRAIIAYIKSTWPEPIRAAQERTDEAYRKRGKAP